MPRSRFHRRRPHWWPESEAWPPHRPIPHRRFFRGIGCLFGLINAAGILILSVLAGLALGGFENARLLIASWAWAVPAGIVVILVPIAAVGAVTMRMRALSRPLDDLLAASEKVAEGDYSTRVEERGPAEVRSLTQAFNSMAGRLQASDQRRRSLLSDVSHELRTPLTVIQGSLEGILDGVYLPDEARLSSILEETRLLSRLVDDLRTLALAESGALQLKRESVDLAALIRETVNSFAAEADRCGVHISLDLAAAAPPLELDPTRMREVLSNLLANGLRYTPPGGEIRIAYREEADAGRGRALVSVADSGPGISPQDLPHVFDRFHKSSDSGGMGLGLAIARYLVEAHGGNIRAESQPDQGTTISFALPH